LQGNKRFVIFIPMKVQLKPISERAKDRVNQHGDTFTLVTEPLSVDTGNPTEEILVRSLGDTWKGETWLGWFSVGNDVEIVSIFS
jgi:hypothetical protein